MANRIGDCVEAIKSWNPKKDANLEAFSYIDLGSIDKQRKDIDLEMIPTLNPGDAPSRARQLVETGDVLVSTVRPNLNGVAKVPRQLHGATASTGFCVLRTKPGLLDSSYLFAWVKSPQFVRDMVKNATGANYPCISESTVLNSSIPLPPLEEQKRIASILDKAESIRLKRERTIAFTDQLLRSVFLDLFGDPVTNPNGYVTQKLGSCVSVVSGATPSKSQPEYWRGKFPWVSPKDMKVDLIFDAKDHISDSVFSETNQKVIPKGSILIVVRGMILIHTVPVGISSREVAINQDIKALIPKEVVNTTFLHGCLIAMHGFLLGLVSTAAHGTKRIETEDLLRLEIPIPNREEQMRFNLITESVRGLSTKVSQDAQLARSLSESLSQELLMSEHVF